MLNYITPNQYIGENDSISIQNAVNAATVSGMNKVVIPRINERTGEGKWIIDKTVRLPSNIEIVLDNCFMQMADGVVGGFFCSDNLFAERATSLKHRMQNITIRGEGHSVLDGGNPTGLSEKTQAALGVPVRLNTPIFFINVDGFTVENISITNQRYWGMRFEFCAKGKIRDIFFNVSVDRRNQDGINLRNGCHDILIENIFGQTGDDMIALSAIDTDIKVGFNEEYPVIVEGHDWDIHDVTIRNISGAAVRHPLVALRNHNGAKMYNIRIENIRDTDYVGDVVSNKFERYALVSIGGNSYAGKRFAEMGETHSISVTGLHANYSVRVIEIQSVIKNLRITDVYAGGVCRAVLATTPDGWADSKSGVKMENVVLDGVFFESSSKENSKLIDFSVMRRGDYIKNLTVRNVTLGNVGAFALLDEITDDFEIKTDNISGNLQGKCDIVRTAHYDETPFEITPSIWNVNGKATPECDM